ncbi:hypothetical protein ACQ4LE_006414 [Meloidogyne hapla]|uniref:Uncharacterized protein n=1 Tax=Meloidogyne hapla TaxID=6305 RepID=A0A1I8B7Z3_MELHA
MQHKKAKIFVLFTFVFTNLFFEAELNIFGKLCSKRFPFRLPTYQTLSRAATVGKQVVEDATTVLAGGVASGVLVGMGVEEYNNRFGGTKNEGYTRRTNSIQNISVTSKGPHINEENFKHNFTPFRKAAQYPSIAVTEQQNFATPENTPIAPKPSNDFAKGLQKTTSKLGRYDSFRRLLAQNFP